MSFQLQKNKRQNTTKKTKNNTHTGIKNWKKKEKTCVSFVSWDQFSDHFTEHLIAHGCIRVQHNNHLASKVTAQVSCLLKIFKSTIVITCNWQGKEREIKSIVNWSKTFIKYISGKHFHVLRPQWNLLSTSTTSGKIIMKLFTLFFFI